MKLSLVLVVVLLCVQQQQWRCLAASPVCEAALLECRNGGDIGVGGEHCAASLSAAAANFGATSECQCPSGLHGSDCSVVESRAACRVSQNTVFDANPLSELGLQRMMCTLDEIKASGWALIAYFDSLWKRPRDSELNSMRDHRLEIDIDWSSRSVSALLKGRPWSTLKRAYIDSELVFDCTFSSCEEIDDPSVDERYHNVRCNEITCRHQRSASFPLLSSMFDSRSFVDMVFNGDESFMRFRLDSLTESQCHIGQCRAPPKYASVLAVAAPVLALLMLLALVYWIIGLHSELHHPPPLLVDLLGQLQSRSDKEEVVDGSMLRRSCLSRSTFAPEEHMEGEVGLVWQNLSYTIDGRENAAMRLISSFLNYFVAGKRRALPRSASQAKVPILQRCSGTVKPGEMVAILGASGAGKSTLLDILGGIRKQGEVDGLVQLSGRQRKQRLRERDVRSYVVQSDYSLATMTVWETVLFSARTRLPRDTSDAELLRRVVQALDEVGMAHVATSLIGSPESGGISGGERRRLAVAVELVCEPRVLLLDEPTSGLDSYYADMMVRVLKRRAVRDRCSVLLTIHQPPAHLFALFDKVLLMGSGGATVFWGAPQHALNFMNAQSGTAYLKGANPFEYLIDCIHAPSPSSIAATSGSGKTVDDCLSKSPHSTALSSNSSSSATSASTSSSGGECERRALVKRLSDAFRTSVEHDLLQRQVVEALVPPERLRSAPKRVRQRLTFVAQIGVLVSRSIRHVCRDPSLLLLYNVITVAVALLSGLTFFSLGFDIAGTQNRVGFCYCGVLFGALLSMSSIDLFVSERILYWREQASGAYSTTAYFISKLIVDLFPFRVLPAITFALVAYYMVGLQASLSHFLVFTATLVLSNTVAGASVFVISTGCANVPSASLIGVVYFLFNIVFGGPFLSRALNAPGEDGEPRTLEADRTLPSMAFLSYFSFFFYAFKTLIANEFVGLDLYINASGVDLPSEQNSAAAAAADENIQDMTGATFLELMNYSPDHNLVNLVVLMCMAVTFNIVAFLLLKFAHKRSK